MTELIDQIRREYEREHVASISPVSASDVPTSYEAITNGWLTGVICRNHPGTEVVGFELGARDDGTANRRRIYLKYNDAGVRARLPSSVFCKATHELLNRITLAVVGGTHAEVTFYNAVHPFLNIDTPSPIFANYDRKSFNSIIMLHDIGDDVEFCSHDATVSWGQAISQVELLARLHGRFLDKCDLLYRWDFQTWPEYFQNVISMGQEHSTDKGFVEAEDVIPKRLFSRAGEIWQATVSAVDIHRSLPSTIIHGDCHLKQWYMRPNGRMGLTDWQCCSIGNWSRDLPYALGTSLSVENRRAWERDLIQIYLDTLGATGARAPKFDEAYLLYRQNLLSALNWWTGTLVPAPDMPEMQPRETSLKFIGRLAQAIDDLDAVDACLA